MLLINFVVVANIIYILEETDVLGLTLLYLEEHLLTTQD